MRTVIIVLACAIATAVPATAEVVEPSAHTAVAASPWIVPALLAIVRTYFGFMERSGDLELGR